MYAVLWVPEFPLQALIRPDSARWRKPLAVLADLGAGGKGSRKHLAPILAVNPAARSVGVSKGMTATQGLARCADLEIFTRDGEAEHAAREALLRCAEGFTPDYEDTSEGVCSLDLGGRCLRGGETMPFGWRLTEALRECSGLHAQAGIGMTVDLAFLAARMALEMGGVCLFDEGQGRTRLEEAPVGYLEPSPALAEVLKLWGIVRIGQFLRLPRGEVSQRLGGEAATLWDKVSGQRRRLLCLVRVPEDYHLRHEFEYEVAELEPLLFVIRRLLETLTARLSKRYLVAERVELTLMFSDQGVREEIFRVPDPSADAALLFNIIHTRLEGFTAEATVVLLDLTLLPTRPKKRQCDLFASGLRDPNRFGQTLARLEALLGVERVGSPRALDTHRRDAFILKPFDDVVEQAAVRARERERSFALGLPLRRFRPALAVSIATAYARGYAAPAAILDGDFQGPLAQCAGPWKRSGGWWDAQAWRREEWDVALADGRLCLLVRDGESGWWLEGVYG